MSERNKVTRKKLLTRYRFVIVEDQTHENKFKIKGTMLGAISAAVLLLLFIVAFVFSMIAYTPLKLIIPGYPSYQTQRVAIENAAKVDSLEKKMKIMTIRLENLRRVLNGEKSLPIDSLINIGKADIAEKIMYTNMMADSILRERVDSVEKYNLSSNSQMQMIEGMLFFPPVKGILTEEFNKAINHPYVDIAVQENSAVCSVLKGTIIAAYWTDETGYNIHIQHDNDLISIYRHNTKLLKKTGDTVDAGTPVSLAGSAGDLSSGPHLHFELWHKGVPIDPTLYIKF
ncbi:MAG: M23 family metallopeptidase [Bacteroidales bacterium]|nr:M23 family metallopeptidase [Bacteroidales bacterium]